MATVGYGECKVNIISREQNGCDDSQNKGLLRKMGLNPVNIKVLIVGSVRKIGEVGVEDPRKILHAMKVALALSLVSLVCLLNPLFTEVGSNSIWAVMTVVVVFEFTAGATLSKGLNRGIGTVMAGSLGFFVCFLSEKVAQGEAVVVGASVFIIGAAATYARFLPFIKKRFDYGAVIFLLTFSMITVTGYRVPNILRMAYQRLSTILIGCGVCLFTSLLVFPIWAGEDLHNSTVNKFQGLVKSLEGCVSEYFDEHPYDNMTEDESEDPIYQGYKSVLDSKASDESLAAFAGWEPRHGRFRYRHPWKQYVKIGVKLRYLAYSIVALHGCLRSEIQVYTVINSLQMITLPCILNKKMSFHTMQTQRSVRSVLKKPCSKVSEEAAKLLREVSCSIKHMRRCDSESMMKQLKLALRDLQAALHSHPKLLIHSRGWSIEKYLEKGSIEGKDLKFGFDTNKKVLRRLMSWHGEKHDRNCETQTQPHSHTLPQCANCIVNEKPMSKHSVEFAEALPLATFACLLVEIVARLQHVIEVVDELARLANFKPCNPYSKQEAAKNNPPPPPPPKYTPKPSLRRSAEIHVSNSFAE
ncbi:hypothetical protein KI387_014252 [Taxus chinensis]|uniref:Aluminum-activated malate transporter n=1 Tax=Taxus chinensis TaxID=29808 RepID=A0AA38CUG0_TAXCH|nr:hypothetical protein KI387_014252 [Taxus chinensis]